MRFFGFSSFFEYITCYFGIGTLNLLKTWIKYNKRLVITSAQIEFLTRCKHSNLCPQHLTCKQFANLNFHHNNTKKHVNNKIKSFANGLLRIEISDNFKYLRRIRHSIHIITKKIFRSLPSNLCYTFFRSQHVSLSKLYNTEHRRIDKKIQILESRYKIIDEPIKNINYFCQYKDPSHNDDLDDCKLYSFKPFKDNNTVMQKHVKLSANNFSNDQMGLYKVNDKWFANLSDTDIPIDVKSLLQLGENFSLPPTDKLNSTIEFIKHVENNIKKFSTTRQTEIRKTVIPWIQKIGYECKKNKNNNNEIISSLRNTKMFVKNNPHIIFTRADKGNTVVCMNKDDYVRRMEDNLADINTYSVLTRSPINKLLTDLKSMLMRWKHLNLITTSTYRYLNCSNAILPFAYGLPKLHKQGFPLRIIVSSINSPLHKIAAYLHNIISGSFPNSAKEIHSSYDLVNEVTKIEVPVDYALISLDVISLFTNIPLELALEGLERRWDIIKINTKLTKEEFFNAIKLVLHSTYFQFNNKIYKQTFGTPMGSPLSPIIADLVMKDLETVSIQKLTFTPTFYYRYVDDIALAAPESDLTTLVEVFNSYHPRLQFTIELGGHSLNFLDVSLIKSDNRIITNWYRKPTASGRYLNFYSCHPLKQKIGTIIGLIDRVLRLSHPEFHQENFEFVIETLINNGYPLDLIFATIKQRLKKIITSKHPEVNENNPTITMGRNNNFFIIPYIPNISEKFYGLFKKNSDIRLAHKSFNKLNIFIKAQKDLVPPQSQSNVVYKINCADCDASYVGQTSRLLKTRITEHRNHINRNTTNTSVITEHRINFLHEFDWDNIKILDKEKFWTKRLISETLHIKRQSHGLNLHTDTELLDAAYDTILNRI